MATKKIAVVGAGIAGLTCAYELQKAGYDVTVFEKEPRVGGRMSSRKKNGLTFDIGANHLCGQYEHMQAYAKELGVPFEKMRFDFYNLFKKGQLMKILDGVGALTKMRLAFEYFKITPKKHAGFFNLSEAAQYDTMSAHDYLKKNLGHDAIDYWVDPFSTTYQFHSCKEISLSLVKAVMELLKFNYHGWDLFQLTGGMIALPEAMAKKLNVKLSTSVNKVVGGKQVTITTDKEAVFDVVVLASTADVTQKIYTNPSAEETSLLSTVRYASTISTAFMVDAARMPDTSVVWVPRAESSTVSGYTNERMKGDGFVKDGKSLLCVWLHEDYAKTLIPRSDDEIYAAVKKEILKYCPWFTSEDQLVSHDIQRWNTAMPKFYTGYLSTVKKFVDEEKNGNNVFLCGDYLNSIWTEGALRCGQRVAEKIQNIFAK